MKLSTPLLACLPVLVLGALAASAQAQTSLLAQTFDGYTAGGTVPFGASQTFLTTNPGIPVSNTNAATLFPGASSGSSVAGGDAGTNYATFGGGASYVARTNTIAGLGGAAFSVYYDVNVPAGAAGGAVILNLVTAAAGDTNGVNPGTFSGFTLSNTGVVGTNGTGVTLTGGTSTTVPLGTQIVLSLVVNDTAAAVPYTSQGFNTSLPAFTSDLYAAAASGITYLGRLTSATGTNATTNTPQQLGFRTFGGNTTSIRINELDVVTGATVAAVPEPTTCVWLVGAAGLTMVVRLRHRSV